MKEYIERASVHSIIEQTSTYTFAWGGMHEKIDSLPAADVVEVRHGRWIHLSKGDSCSECGYHTGRYESGKNYCPNCGSRMDKEDEQ